MYFRSLRLVIVLFVAMFCMAMSVNAQNQTFPQQIGAPQDTTGLPSLPPTFSQEQLSAYQAAADNESLRQQTARMNAYKSSSTEARESARAVANAARESAINYAFSPTNAIILGFVVVFIIGAVVFVNTKPTR